MMDGEPSARATQLLAFRSAAVTLWGTAGWQEVIDRLPADARDSLAPSRLLVAVGWVPERHLITLAQAVFEGPARGGEDAYREFVHGVIARGFGRIRRVLVQFASPAAVLKRAPELWRHDHTHGELTVEILPSGAVAILTHPIIPSTPLSRQTAAEMFRAVLCLTRARNVRQEHQLSGKDRLRVSFQWE
jgi:hypothetical protein